jgi:hypothetical protein
MNQGLPGIWRFYATENRYKSIARRATGWFSFRPTSACVGGALLCRGKRCWHSLVKRSFTTTSRTSDPAPVDTRTITSRRVLENQLRSFRRLGHTWEREEGETGVACLAAPVFGHRDQLVAAVRRRRHVSADFENI